MAIAILFFGSLVDITSVSDRVSDNFTDTDKLITFLEQEYPYLKSAKYLIAVNQQMITINTQLNPGDSVALMPPFSGG